MDRALKSREILLAGAILALILLISTRFPAFARPANLANVFNDTSILIVLALGQMAVILTKCIDLSVAANLALTGMVVAMLNQAFPGAPVLGLLALALVLGAALGAVNGLLVWRLEIPPIVVTLGTLTIYRGLIFVLSGGEWINAHEMSPAFKALPRTLLLGLPLLSWIAVLVVVAVWLLVTRTALGRAFYAVGGNPHAAAYAGIDVGRTRFAAFVLSGALGGLCGYLWVARYAVAYVDIAAGFELDVIAACVIGGVSIAGGVGSVAGAVMGALFLGVIKNALPVVNISPFWQLAISGAAIIVAVAVNARAERRKGRVILKSAEAAA
ncbi:ABC transporter permease [Amaricoccus sp.]|uniref:ABC transporter permease n=1 Tax=Amaricoccus sp. TaxID=1872485 RepID=UPI001B591992|nr:ABC transporter permease [Amaricoccus sp.]MBP7002950.1 ABC transporter permease [Amaricoccus sp.]